MSSPESARYQILDEIGRGGMATVYLARDEVAEMEVALKVIHEYLMADEGMVEAFVREAALMQSVEHPGVVRVHGVTEVDGRPAIAMEYCPGGDLRQYLLRKGPLEEAQALKYFEQILDALAAIHEQGVVHRDVKPQNVIFAADGKLKLIDFGIGQAQELMEADESGQVGTVEYMAPERVDGFAVDGRSDLYSAAVMLFEMVCGHVPYRGDSAAAVMRMHRQAPVPDPTLFASGLSPRLGRAITRGLAKHPEERFDRAQQMKAFLAGDDDQAGHVDDHRRWTDLRREFDARAWMAAPVEEEGQEWILFSADRWEGGTGNLEKMFDAVRAMTEPYESYLTVEPPRSRNKKGEKPSLGERRRWMVRAFTMHPGKYTLLRGTYDGDFQSLEYSIDPSQRLTVARGLSRAGAEKLMDDFEAQGLCLRYARVPRATREQERKRFLLDDGVVGGMIMVFGIYMLMGYLPCLLDTEAQVVPLFLYGGAVVWAVMAAAAVALLPNLIGRKSAHRPENALFDFCLPDDARGDEQTVRLSHLQLAAEIQSPRVAASFERGLNLALHLQDILDDSGFDGAERAQSLVDGLADLSRRIIDLEYRVATLRPGQIASRIRRLDLQIAAEDDMDKIDDLMEQKRALRERLEERDADQVKLEGLAQKLLDMTARLEEMVRAYRSQDQADSTDDEVVLDFSKDLDGLSAEIEALVVEESSG